MELFIGILLDVIFVGIIVYGFSKGHRDGFAKTLVSLLGFLIAAIIASSVAAPSAKFVYNSFVEKPAQTAIENSLTEQIDSLGGSQNSEIALDSISDAIKKLPAVIRNSITFDEKLDEISGEIIKADKETVKEVSAKITDGLIKPTATAILTAIMFCIIFGLASLVCKIISSALKIVNKIPLLGGVNAMLGAIIGLVKGIVIALVFNWILISFVYDYGSIFKLLTADTINRSLIMKNVFEFNPIKSVTDLFLIK